MTVTEAPEKLFVCKDLKTGKYLQQRGILKWNTTPAFLNIGDLLFQISHSRTTRNHGSVLSLIVSLNWEVYESDFSVKYTHNATDWYIANHRDFRVKKRRKKKTK